MALAHARLGLTTLTLVIGFAVGLSACNAPTQAPLVSVATEHNLQGTQWTAVAIDGAVPVVDPKPTLRWTSPQQIVGSAGCNQFRGRAVVGPDSLHIGPLGGVGRACITTPSGQEDMFFKALENTRSGRIEDGQLVLLDEHAKVLARFVNLNAQTP